MPAAGTTNLTLQDLLPLDTSEHLTIPLGTTTLAVVRNALSRPGPADPALDPTVAVEGPHRR